MHTMSDELKVNEIFYSIDGEGERSGYPAIFIRLTGCNLRCSYCDTTYAFDEGENMSIDAIISEIKLFNCKRITLTGGEPLMQENAVKLLKKLKKEKYDVIVETNGAVDITEAQKYAKICMDWKTPSSKMRGRMDFNNLYRLRKKDVLKIVMNNNDIEYVQNLIDNPYIKAPIYVSPIFGEIELPILAEFAKENDVRMQLQIHKYIWDVNKRGV